MKCPFCGHMENKVVDSRISQGADITRRRRECLACNSRFTTYERVEELMPSVTKKDGRNEDFNREKIVLGIQLACRKRPFSPTQIEALVREIELQIQALGVREISSRTIGDFVMEKLRRLDKVAYIRFASVYKDFKDVDEFLVALEQESISSTPLTPEQ